MRVPARQLVAHLAHLAAIGMEERQRRPGPREHAHVDAAGCVGEQLAKRRAAVAHLKCGREEPAGDVDVRLRRADVGDHARQHVGAVDEELDGRAGTRRERAGLRPAAGRRSERAQRGRAGGGGAGGARGSSCSTPEPIAASRRLRRVAFAISSGETR